MGQRFPHGRGRLLLEQASKPVGATRQGGSGTPLDRRVAGTDRRAQGRDCPGRAAYGRRDAPPQCRRRVVQEIIPMSSLDPDFIKFKSISGICGSAVVFGLFLLLERPGTWGYLVSPILIVGGVVGF